jgi:hypothetical protein
MDPRVKPAGDKQRVWINFIGTGSNASTSYRYLRAYLNHATRRDLEIVCGVVSGARQ